MDNFRTDVIYPEEARIISGKRDYKAENAKLNDLGWSDWQRRKAIEEIVRRWDLTGTSARAIEVQTDTYLKARVEMGRVEDRKPNRTDAEASPGRAEGDAESDAYARSVAKLNSWRDRA